MKTSTLTRLGLTLAMSGALAAMSLTSHAQHGQDVSAPHKAAAQQDKQEQKDPKKEAKEQKQQQHRLSQQEQQARIREQKQLLAEYNQRIAQQQAIALRNAQQLWSSRSDWLITATSRRTTSNCANSRRASRATATTTTTTRTTTRLRLTSTAGATTITRPTSTAPTSSDRHRTPGTRKATRPGAPTSRTTGASTTGDPSPTRTPTMALTAAMCGRKTTTTTSAKDSSAAMKMATTSVAPMAPMSTVRFSARHGAQHDPQPAATAVEPLQQAPWHPLTTSPSQPGCWRRSP